MAGITIKMLAKELGLSVATISKALKDSHEISAATKQLVREAADRFDYVPNPYASSLRRKKSRTIAVVLPEVADSFFSLAINGIESVAREKAYHVLIYLTFESMAREKAILHDFHSGRVDGVLISVSQETTDGKHISDLMNRNIPLVFFDRVIAEVDAAKIITDDAESSYRATRHLLEQGCRRITYLSTSEKLSISSSRMEGYLKALAEVPGKRCKPAIIYCPGNAEENCKTLLQLLKKKGRPDGILASVEKLTTPLYLAAATLGLQIPEDLKLICFSNLSSAAILNPPLSTVTQPAFEMGRAAALLLFKALEKKWFDLNSEMQVIPSFFVVRGSSLNSRLQQ